MNSTRWRQVEELFHAALARQGEDRAVFLAQACGDDEALRREVLALLECHHQAGQRFLESPAIARAAAPALESGRRIGAWRIEREIGRGGMGAVYLASRADQQFEKQVAVKLVGAGLDTDFLRRRFRAERQILASLEHPNITRLIDGGVTEQGQPYLVMDYIEGMPLKQYCEEHRLTVPQRLTLFSTICGAVQYAHQNLVIHRDLKPGNILVTAGGAPKLLDFGTAKLLAETPEAPLTAMTGAGMMTLAYASPEQMRGEAVSTVSDVYSLGVTLYELLAGRRPWGEDPATLYNPEREGARPSVTAARAGDRRLAALLQGDLDNIVMKALQKRPDQRYGSAAQLAEDLQRHLAGLPVLAHPPALLYRMGKFVARHAWGTATAAAAALALLAATMVSVHQARVANRERIKAERTSEFVQQILAGADSSWNSTLPGRGRDLKVADILDHAAGRLSTELKDWPEAEGALRRTLGSSYRVLAMFEPAEKQLRLGAEKLRAAYGENHVETIMAVYMLGQALLSKGDLRAAEDHLRKARNAMLRLQPDDPRITPMGNDLAVALGTMGRWGEAAPLVREFLQASRQRYGPVDVRVAIAASNLGVVYNSSGDVEQAQKSFQESADIFRQMAPRTFFEEGVALAELAGIHRLKGENTEAKALFQKALDIFRSRLGPTHPRVATSLAGLAQVLSQEGDHLGAVSHVLQALEIQKKSLPAEHPEVASSLNILGVVQTASGRPREGEAALRQALAIRKKLLAETDWKIADSTVQLGVCMAAQGRRSEAKPLLEEGYRRFRDAFGENHARTIQARERLNR